MPYTYTQSFETPMDRDRRRLEELQIEEKRADKHAALNDTFRFGTGALGCMTLLATGGYAQYTSTQHKFHDNSVSMLDAAWQSAAIVTNGLLLLYTSWKLIARAATAPSARKESQRLDFERYALSLENPHVFDGQPVCRDPTTPDRYHGRHGQSGNHPDGPKNG